MTGRHYTFKRLPVDNPLTISRYAAYRDGQHIGLVEQAIDVTTVTDRPLWRSFNLEGFLQGERLDRRIKAAQAIGGGVGVIIQGRAR